MTSKLASALELARQGYRVFPLVQNGKTPVHDGNWRKLASTDPARIAEMWTCPVMEAELDYNIGIALDQTTIVVDVDTRDGKQGDKQLALLEAIYDSLPATYTIDSANGGEHRYYRVEDSSVFAAKLSTDIDLKGEGGYVVGPGSTIEDRAYRARPQGERDKALLPPWVRDHAPAGRRKRDDGMERGNHAGILVETDSESAIARATDYLAKAAPDHGTYLVAARVKDFGVSKDKCLELLMEHWEPAASKGEEHVSFRVDNAYSYGQNPIGNRSPEAEFDAVEIDQTKEPPKRGKLYFTPWANAQLEAERPYLIDGVLETGSMIVTYGDSNTGKTFVALDQAYHIAAGKDWNGHKVNAGAVVYVASEGGPGFFKRIEALKRHHGGKDVPFFTVPCLVDLYADTGSTGPLVKLVREIEAIAGKVALIVIDTLARAMGGGDENASTDMGKFVANCDRIRAATGAALNIVHHTGKDKARGARGSSALRAATDTEIEIDAGTMTMMKQRDAGKSDGLRFTLDVLEVGRRADGEAITSCVVRWIQTNEFSDEVSPLAEELFEVLEKLIAAKRDEIAEDDEIEETDKNDKIASASIPWKTWEKAALNCLKGARGKPMTRSNLFPLRLELSNSGRVSKTQSKQWFI